MFTLAPLEMPVLNPNMFSSTKSKNEERVNIINTALQHHIDNVISFYKSSNIVILYSSCIALFKIQGSGL